MVHQNVDGIGIGTKKLFICFSKELKVQTLLVHLLCALNLILSYQRDCPFLWGEVKRHSKVESYCFMKTEKQFQETLRSICLSTTDDWAKKRTGRDRIRS